MTSPADDNVALARLLYELGVLTGRAGGPGARHRAGAYRRAALTIAAADVDVLAMAAEERTTLPGVGRGVAARIDEVRRTGRIGALERLRSDDPAGVEELMRVPGVGRVTAARLRDHLGVTDLADLREAAVDGRLRDVPGIGDITARRISEGVDALDGRSGGAAALPIGVAVMAADRLESALRAVIPGLADVTSVHWAGQLARMRDLVDQVDLLVVTDTPADVLRAVGRAPVVREVVGRRPDVVEITMFEGTTATITACAPAQHAPLLLKATSHPVHWQRLQRRAADLGMRLDETGLHLEGADGRSPARPSEHGVEGGHEGALAFHGPLDDVPSIYAALALQHIPAEQRDGTDEIELAAAGRLPRCAEVGDLRGDLHDHTEWSGDGRMTLAELCDGAESRGWEYVAVTDHAEDLTINGLSRDMMRRQARAIDGLSAQHPDLTVLHGAELNIGREGDVDYDAEFLAGFGWTVASVHSHFRLPAGEQTRRLVRAMENPAVSAIGHLTGRRIGRRQGIDLDVDVVLDALLRTGTALEVNCHLDRFDAPAEILAEAARRGVHVVISTDAHGASELDNHRWGVALARRGRVPVEMVANTWPAERFLDRWGLGRRARL